MKTTVTIQLIKLKGENLKVTGYNIDEHNRLHVELELPTPTYQDICTEIFDCELVKEQLTDVSNCEDTTANVIVPQYKGYAKSADKLETYIMTGHTITNPEVSPTKAQAEAVALYNKLHTVAKYVNKGWVPNWNNDNSRVVTLRYVDDEIGLHTVVVPYLGSRVPFKDEDAALLAIEIMGEQDLLKLFKGMY